MRRPHGLIKNSWSTVALGGTEDWQFHKACRGSLRMSGPYPGRLIHSSHSHPKHQLLIHLWQNLLKSQRKLALHWFWFGTSAWCKSATFQEKVKQGSWSNQKERHWFCSLSPNLHNFWMKACSTIFKAVWDSPRCAWSSGKKKNPRKNLLWGAKTWQNLLKSQRKQSCPFRTTLQNSNESQTWPPDESELPHAGTALVLVWDLCLVQISNFSRKS